jgi:predicted DNA binding protein
MEAVLEVTHAGCYTSKLTMEHPVMISVLSGHATREGNVGLWEMTGPEDALAAAVAQLEDHPNIVRVDVLQRRDGSWILETLDTEAEVANALIGAGLVFLPPVLIRNGTETYRVFAIDRHQVDNAVKALEPKNTVRVLALREHVTSLGALSGLTEKQRAALEAAVRDGYYDRPRATDLDTLARKLGVSRPTLGEHLARAESKVMHGLFGG